MPLETVAVPPTEIFPVIKGKTEFEGAAIAVGTPRRDKGNAKITVARANLENVNLFIGKSFHSGDLLTRYATTEQLFPNKFTNFKHSGALI